MNRRPALRELRRAIEAQEDQVPCRGSRSEWWVSEDADQRASAAVWCGRCPLLALCAAAALERPRPTWGVWAGRDRSFREVSGATRRPRAVKGSFE